MQQAILERLWSSGPATVERIREALLPAHRLKDSSVRTLLRRLEARGYVSHRLDGKSFVYEAMMAPKRVAAHSVRQIIERFWSGSVEQFLTGMVDEQLDLSSELPHQPAFPHTVRSEPPLSAPPLAQKLDGSRPGCPR